MLPGLSSCAKKGTSDRPADCFSGHKGTKSWRGGQGMSEKFVQSCLAGCWLSRFFSFIPLLPLSCSSLVPLLFLSYPSLIPFFHLRFIFVSGLFFLRLEMRVVWDRNGNRSCMVPSVCNEFPFIAFIPHLVKMGMTLSVILAVSLTKSRAWLAPNVLARRLS